MKMIGVGRFTADPVATQVKDTIVCKFSLAVPEYRKVNGERKKVTHFFDFEIWDKAAELIVQYKKKGDLLLVEATPRQDRWEDDQGNKKQKVIFRVDNFEFISSGKPEGVPEKEHDTKSDEGTPF